VNQSNSGFRNFTVCLISLLVINISLYAVITGWMHLNSDNSDEINILYAWLGAFDRIIFGIFTFQFARSLHFKIWPTLFYTVMSMSLFFVSVFGLYYTYYMRRNTFNPET
jgi:hypothetical protein